MANKETPPGVRFMYQERSRLVIIFFAILEIGCLIGMIYNPFNFYLWFGAFFAIMISVNISSVTVVIDDESIYVVYGIGLFQKVMDIHSIEYLDMVPNNTIQAIYSRSAENAIKLIDRNGKRATIGIGQTRQMLDFLRSKVRGG